MPAIRVTASPMLIGSAVLTTIAALLLFKMGPAAGLAFALIPLVVVTAGILVGSGRILVFVTVFALPLSGINIQAHGVPLGSVNVHLQDMLIILAFGGWALGLLIYRLQGKIYPRVPFPSLLGWPLCVFAVLMLIPLLRGHYAYGASLIGEPVRLVAYAAIVFAYAGATPERIYHLLLWVFYTGTVVTMLWAGYYIATGTSQTTTVPLSTGGVRPLAVSTSLYCAGALFLALLTVRNSPGRARNLFHVAIATLALAGVVLGFGRGVFVAVALVLLVLLISSSGVRRGVFYSLPLALPFLCLLAIIIVHVAPSLVSSFQNRISAPPAQDVNVRWREQASAAVLEQVREQPIVGVGFGRGSTFFLNLRDSSGYTLPFRYDIGQDPHDGYLYILAGGGILALGAFVVLIGGFVVEAARRYRGSRNDTERLLIVWAAATLFCFLFEAASGTMFEDTTDLLAIWAIIVLPGVVSLRKGSVLGVA